MKRIVVVAMVVVVFVILSGCDYTPVAAADEQQETTQVIEADTPVEAPLVPTEATKPPVVITKTAKAPATTKAPTTKKPPVVAQTAKAPAKKIVVDHSLSLDYAGTTDGSIANARRALSLINGYILSPGETFSFNEVVGPRTYDRGFVNAPLIVGNGVGGGVCKASTALYQAAKAAGMTILERHNHSKSVPYARPGNDAMVSGDCDNRFRNATTGDMQFVCSLKNRVARVVVYRLN